MTPTTRVRSARAADYPAFVRLFPELGTDDPPIAETRFVAEIAATTLIAEDERGDAAGYAYYQIMKEVAYVRHLVTAPHARRRGVGRALLWAIAERARRESCTTWCLNVKPDNTAAILLYERMNMVRAFASYALRIDWASAGAEGTLGADDTPARLIAAEDDARVERTMSLANGQLATARALEGRVLMMMEETAGRVVGVAVFDPQFPGAFPFRVERTEVAGALLRALRPYARATDTFLNLMVEDQPDVVDALRAAGATVRLPIVHMRGPLPADP